MRHLIDITDLSNDEISRLADTADRIIADRQAFSNVCAGKKLATLFFEPSTRTRLSFEAAMLELGGSVLGFSSADSSSASRARACPTRCGRWAATPTSSPCSHPKEGAPMAAAAKSPVPIINARATAVTATPRRRWRTC